MIQFQQDFTNAEQSKRLLELGLPADSANLGGIEDIMHGGVEILTVPYSQWCKGYENISTPLWSVGRLMEIFDICVFDSDTYIHKGWDTHFDLTIDYIEFVVKMFELATAKEALDFSKLEEQK